MPVTLERLQEYERKSTGGVTLSRLKEYEDKINLKKQREEKELLTPEEPKENIWDKVKQFDERLGITERISEVITTPIERIKSIPETIKTGDFKEASKKTTEFLQEKAEPVTQPIKSGLLQSAVGMEKTRQLADKFMSSINPAERAMDWIFGDEHKQKLQQLDKQTLEQYDKAIEEARKDYSTSKGIKKFASESVEAAAAMIPSMVLALATGGATGLDPITAASKSLIPGLTKGGVSQFGNQLLRLLPFGMQAAGGAAREAEKEGANTEQQILYGASSGLAEMVTETLPLGVLEKIFDNKNAKNLVKKGAANFFQKYGKRGLLWLENTIAQAGQEVIVDPITQFAKKSIYDKSVPLTGEGGIFSIEQAGESAKMAIGMSLVFAALGIPASALTRSMVENRIQQNRPITTQEIVSAIEQDKAAGVKIEAETPITPTKTADVRKSLTTEPMAKTTDTATKQLDTPTVAKSVQVKQTDDIIPSKEVSGLSDKITIPYRKNTEKAPIMASDEFAQSIEPKGDYINYHDIELGTNLPKHEYGNITFKKPLIVEYETTGHGGWKTKLSEKYGGKKGTQLSSAIKKDGYDGIITVDKGKEIREIVNLGGIKSNVGTPQKAMVESDILSLSQKQTDTVKPKVEAVKADTGIQASIVKTELPFKTGTGRETVKRSDIQDFISKSLDIPVSQGKFRQRAYGIFKVKPEVIRLKKTKDLSTLYHETGHFLDKRLNLSETDKNAKIETELMAMGKPTSMDTYTKTQVKKEGVAEFIRVYLTNEQEAKKTAPELYKKFRDVLDKDLTLDNMMKTIQQATENYLKQSPETRILSNISKDKKDNKLGINLSRLYTLTFDDLNPLKKTVEAITGGAKIETNSNPFELAWLNRGWQGKAETYLKYGVVDENFKKVGKSLSEILKGIENFDDFRAYAVAKRGKELSERKVETGLATKDIDAVIQKYDKEYSKAFNDLVEYQDNVLKQLVTQGIISKSDFAAIKKLNQDYVPFNRIIDAFEKKGRGKGLQATQPIKGIKGSTRDIIDPLESIIKNTFIITNMAERNRVGKVLVELTEKFEGAGKFIDKVPPPVRGQSFQLSEIKNVLEAAGMEIETLENLDLEKIATVFRPTRYTGKDNIITIYRDGKAEYYEVFDETLYKSLMALDKEGTNTLMKILAYPTKFLRAGAILNPDFMARNPVRDAMTAFLYSKYGFLPGVDTARGLFHVIAKDKTYYKCLASGGLQASFVSLDRDYLQKNLRSMMAEHTRNKALNILKNPVDALRALSEFTEEATRVGEFAKGLKKEGATAEGIRRASLSSRDVSLDFSRGGEVSKQANKLIAFFNAAMQGTDRMVRAFKDNPVRTTTRTLVGITLPSILLYMMNKDDPRYQELPQWQKDLFWIILTKDKIYRIPKPFEVGVLFGTLPERILKWIDEDDPKALDGFMNTLKEAALPDIIPTSLAPIIEAWSNYSFFKGYSIVPESQKNLEPWAQYSQYTSETAKIIGKALNVSPRIIENTIYGYGAGLAGYGIDIIDVVLETSGLVDKKVMPKEDIENLPVLKGFMAKAYQNSDSINSFYELRDDIQKKVSTADKPDIKLKSQLSALNKSSTEIGKLRKEINKIYDSKIYTEERKRELIDKKTLQMVNIARRALQKKTIR